MTIIYIVEAERSKRCIPERKIMYVKDFLSCNLSDEETVKSRVLSK